MAQTSTSGPSVRQDRHFCCPIRWSACRRSTESRCPAKFSPFVHSTCIWHRSAFSAENRKLSAGRTFARHDCRHCCLLCYSCRNKGKLHMQSKLHLCFYSCTIINCVYYRYLINCSTCASRSLADGITFSVLTICLSVSRITLKVMGGFLLTWRNRLA